MKGGLPAFRLVLTQELSWSNFICLWNSFIITRNLLTATVVKSPAQVISRCAASLTFPHPGNLGLNSNSSTFLQFSFHALTIRSVLFPQSEMLRRYPWCRTHRVVAYISSQSRLDKPKQETASRRKNSLLPLGNKHSLIDSSRRLHLDECKANFEQCSWFRG